MKATIILLVIIVAAVLAGGSLYIVQEGEQAVITQFGRPVRVVTEAGLNVKTPFVQKVNRLEKRLLPWDGAPEDMQTRDKKRIFIDVWARWRIVDPMTFFKAVRTERRGYGILDELVDSAVRDVVAANDLIEAVRSTNDELEYESEELAKEATARREMIETGRAKMEDRILKAASVDLEKQYGMELTEVHIKRINYVETVRQTVYDRMRSERMRIAQLFQSEAEEEKNRILGLTQKELDKIEGEMQQKSAEIRGEANAKVIAIAAEAFSKSPEFYEFLRRLELYRLTLGQRTRLVLSTDNELLGELLNAMPAGEAATSQPQ